MTLLVEDTFFDAAADSSGTLVIANHHPTSDATLTYEIADPTYQDVIYRNDATYGNLFASGGATTGTGNLAVLINYTAPSDDMALKWWVKAIGAYNSGGETDFAYGDVGMYGRVTYIAANGSLKKYQGYGGIFRMQDNTVKILKRIVTVPSPGTPFETITTLASVAVPTLALNATPVPYEAVITGTNPVNIKILDGTGSTVLEYNDSASDRITTGRKVGPVIRTTTGNSPYMSKWQLNSVAAAAVPVSFSGSVPTRNGIVGSAASFANAGFFAGDQTPFAYTNVGAALPAGLTLSSSTGIISGTPTTAATTSGIIIRATDTASNIANTNSYSIVIAATNASPTFPGNITNISGTNGSAITPVNVSGQFSDTDTLTYSASPAGTAWPTGITINSSTGIISGTSSTTATTTGCKVRATDTASQTVDSNAFNFVIAAAPSAGNFAASGQIKNLNGSVLPDGSYKVILRTLTNDTATPLVKTALAVVSGVVPAFALAGTVAGTTYVYEPVNEADNTIRGLARAVAT